MVNTLSTAECGCMVMQNEFCKRDFFFPPACFSAHPDYMCQSKHAEKHTELVLLGPPSDWSALRLEAGLAVVGVSQNQTPHSSRVHSLRICRVELIDTRCFFYSEANLQTSFLFDPLRV